MHSPPKNRMSRNHAGRCAKNGAADTLCPLRHFVLANFCAARGAKRLFALDLLFARDPLAGLVADRAARLAGGLAGASAFATPGHLSLGGFRYRLDHKNCLLAIFFRILSLL